MKQLLLVFLGGGLGSALRYLIAVRLNPLVQNFYLGTFVVNILGCFFIGLLLGSSLKQQWLGQTATVLLATGFCGGFTTFSAFALEKYTLLKEGGFTPFFLYLIITVVTGLLAVMAGAYLSK